MEMLLPWVFSLTAIAILSFFGILAASNNAEGWATFWGLLLLGVIVGRYELTLPIAIMIAVAYFIAGFLWSFFRYSRWLRNSIDQYRKENASYDEERLSRYMKDYTNSLTPSKNVSLLVMWVLIWPFSMVENLCGDLVRLVRTLVVGTFNDVYENIFKRATANITESK